MFQNPTNTVNVIIPHVIYYIALCDAKGQYFLLSHGNVTLTCAMLPCDAACVCTHIRISESFTIYLLIENKNEKSFKTVRLSFGIIKSIMTSLRLTVHLCKLSKISLPRLAPRATVFSWVDKLHCHPIRCQSNTILWRIHP